MGADAREPSRLQLAPRDHIPNGVLVDVESPSCLPDSEEPALALDPTLFVRILHRHQRSTVVVDYVDLRRMVSKADLSLWIATLTLLLALQVAASGVLCCAQRLLQRAE